MNNTTEWLRKQIAKVTRNPAEADRFASELKATDWQSYLEENVDDLPDVIAEVDELKRRVTELEERSARKSDRGPLGYLPAGTISGPDFYRQHGISYNKYRYHVEKGYDGDVLETTDIPHPTKPGVVKERYLTPEQQEKAIAYWHKYGVKRIAESSQVEG